MNKRQLLDIAKYVLAVGLLIWVVRSNWAPNPSPRAVASLAASTLAVAPQPLNAVMALTPDRLEPPGLRTIWRRHVEQGEPIRTGLVLLAFVVYTLAVFLTLVRWYMLVRALDLEISFPSAMRYGLIGIFFNTFLPGAVGGDLIKAAALASGQKRQATAFATVIMDRLLALWALVWFVALLGGLAWWLGFLTGPAQAAAAFIVTFALVIAVVSGLMWLLVGLLPTRRADRFAERLTQLPVVGPTLAEFWRAVWMYRSRQATVAVVLLITWGGQVGFLTSFYFGLLAFWSPVMGSIPTYVEHFLLVPMGVVMQALMPTPGGAGGGEWGFGALYLLFRAAEANGVLASLIQRLFAWVVGFIGYGVFLAYRPPVQSTDTETSASSASKPLSSSSRAVAG